MTAVGGNTKRAPTRSRFREPFGGAHASATTTNQLIGGVSARGLHRSPYGGVSAAANQLFCRRSGDQ